MGGGEKASMMDIPETSGPGVRRLGQEDYCKFKASMGYSVRLCQNKERKEEEEKETIVKSIGGLLGK